jgi:hypothetical protein
MTPAPRITIVLMSHLLLQKSEPVAGGATGRAA